MTIDTKYKEINKNNGIDKTINEHLQKSMKNVKTSMKTF